MTQEEKDILLKDLCVRLPYGVKGLHREEVHSITIMDASGLYPSLKVDGYDAWFPVETFKPYLRPMSSMTEEEKEEMHKLLSPEGTAVYRHDGISTPVSHFGDFIPYEYMSRVIAWLAKNQFDYNGLIPMGLAIELIKE